MPLSYSKAADIKKFHREIGWNYKPKQEAFFKVKKRNTHGQWDEHFDKDGIIDVCVKDNKKKYTKAFDTSLMQPEWQVKLGCAGETSFAQRIIQGNVSANELEGIPQGAKLLLQELAALPDMVPVSD